VLEKLRYEFSKTRLRTERLVMGYIIRNEAEMIEANIRMHAQFGIDAFIVFDHLSDDATPEIIHQLASEFPIFYQRKTDKLYKQCEWSTEIVHLAKSKYKADWVIVNDADEFWIPRSGSDLKAGLNNNCYVGRVNRFNMLPNAEQLNNGTYHLIDKIVANPVTYFDTNQTIAQPTRELLGIQRLKLIVRPQGLLRMKPGNHRADHLGMRHKFDADSIRILHYPIRSIRQLEKKLRLQGETYAAQLDLRKLKEGTGGPHLHRLLTALSKGDVYFKEFCDGLLPAPEQLQLLMSLGVVEHDETMSTLLAPIINRDSRR
jgi:hypothetical protein